MHLIVSGQPSAFCFLEMKVLLSIISEGTMPSSKCCPVVALLFSFMRFHECLRFIVFNISSVFTG